MPAKPLTSLGIVPARKGSQRFPDKHHVLLLGKPMFAYTLEAALGSKRLTRVVVSSDDHSLRPMAEQYGVEFIERPAELCTATAALDDAVRHACRLLEERDGFRPDLLVTMQGNVPVRKEGQIDEVVRRFEELPQATAVCTAHEPRVRPEWAYRISDPATGEARRVMPDATAYRMQDYPPLFLLDGALLGVRRQTLFEEEGNRAALGWCGKRLHLVVQPHPMYALEVDYPEQQALAEFYLLYRRHGERWLQQLSGLETAGPALRLS